MTSYTEQEILAWLDELSRGRLTLLDDIPGLASSAIELLSGQVLVPYVLPAQLSEHFTLEELVYSDTAKAEGIDNRPDQEAISQLWMLANHTLEKIRTICGDHAVVISSGFRCPELNAAVGGATNSAHLFGAAADFTIPDFGSVDQICATLAPHLEELEIDQLINETGGGASWVHVGRAVPPDVPRHQCMNLQA